MGICIWDMLGKITVKSCDLPNHCYALHYWWHKWPETICISIFCSSGQSAGLCCLWMTRSWKPKTISTRLSGAREREWNQITTDNILTFYSVLKCMSKTDRMSKFIRNNKWSDISTMLIPYWTWLVMKNRKNKQDLNIMSYFTALVCASFFLSLQSMRMLKILILSNRINSFHTKMILKVPRKK